MSARKFQTVGTIVCDGCLTRLQITEEDLGFEEFECDECGYVFSIPETAGELEEYNRGTLNAPRGKVMYRIMVEGEDGYEFCAKNGIDGEDEDLLNVLLIGYRAMYPDSRRVFVEEEMTYVRMTTSLVSQHILAYDSEW